MFSKKAAIFAFWGDIFASFFEIGFDSSRGPSASLIDPTNQQLLRHPHTDRPVFLRSMSLQPRTAVRPGRYAGLLLLRKSGPELAGWRDKTPIGRRGCTAFGGACFRGAGPGSKAQTSARRSAVTRTDHRRRVSEDVARETFCSACSPRVGGNNTGYAATSGPDSHAGSRHH